MLFSYLWGDKYLPKTINELYCKDKEIKQIIDNLQKIKIEDKNTKNGFIIYHEESSSINLQTIKVILNHCNFSIQQLNCDCGENIKLDVKLQSICIRNITDIFNNKKTALLIDEQLKKKNLDILKNYFRSNKKIPIFFLLKKKVSKKKKLYRIIVMNFTYQNQPIMIFLN